jgi:hypothetical protein
VAHAVLRGDLTAVVPPLLEGLPVPR